MFTTLKKKYLRKKRELKETNKSGTSAEAVLKAEKAFCPYGFMRLLDDFVQRRDNLPAKGPNNEEEDDKDEEFIRTTEDVPSPNDEEEHLNSTAYASEQTDPVKSSAKVSSKSGKKQRSGIKGTPRENLMEDMEFSLIKNLNDRISGKRKADDQTNEETNEDLFCKSLAADLKELPPYERCMAKNEMRNILFKYQMSVMTNQHHQTSFQAERAHQSTQYGFTQFNQPSSFNRFPTSFSAITSPPATPVSHGEQEQDIF